MCCSTMARRFSNRRAWSRFSARPARVKFPFSLATPGAAFSSADESALRQHHGAETVPPWPWPARAAARSSIRGGRLTVDQGFVTSVNRGAGAGPDISVQVNHLAVQNNGLIRSVSVGNGPGGNVAIAADDVHRHGGQRRNRHRQFHRRCRAGREPHHHRDRGHHGDAGWGPSVSPLPARARRVISRFKPARSTLVDSAISLAAADAGNAGMRARST